MKLEMVTESERDPSIESMEALKAQLAADMEGAFESIGKAEEIVEAYNKFRSTLNEFEARKFFVPKELSDWVGDLEPRCARLSDLDEQEMEELLGDLGSAQWDADLMLNQALYGERSKTGTERGIEGIRADEEELKNKIESVDGALKELKDQFALLKQGRPREEEYWRDVADGKNLLKLGDKWEKMEKRKRGVSLDDANEFLEKVFEGIESVKDALNEEIERKIRDSRIPESQKEILNFLKLAELSIEKMNANLDIVVVRFGESNEIGMIREDIRGFRERFEELRGSWDVDEIGKLQEEIEKESEKIQKLILESEEKEKKSSEDDDQEQGGALKKKQSDLGKIEDAIDVVKIDLESKKWLDDLNSEKPDLQGEVKRKYHNPETQRNLYEEAGVSEKLLMVLEENLEQVRRKYFQKDYEMDKGAGGLKRFFGKSVGLGVFEKELEAYEKDYQEALEKYQKAYLKIEQNKQKAFEDLVYYLSITERMSKEDMRIQVEAENAVEEGNLFEAAKDFMANASKKFLDLRRMSKERVEEVTGSQELAKGVDVAMAGAGVLAVGFGVPIAREFAAFATAVEVKEWLEKSANQKRVEDAKWQAGKILKKVERFKEPENIADQIEKHLGLLNQELMSEIQSGKTWEKWRTVAAGVAGLTVWAMGRPAELEAAESVSSFQGSDSVSSVTGAAASNAAVGPSFEFFAAEPSESENRVLAVEAMNLKSLLVGENEHYWRLIENGFPDVSVDERVTEIYEKVVELNSDYEAVLLDGRKETVRQWLARLAITASAKGDLQRVKEIFQEN